MVQTIKSGVATGDTVQEIFKLAKEKSFALPAANVISSSTINAVLETAKELNAPVISRCREGWVGITHMGDLREVLGG